jgi:hypothetical protein
MILSALVIAVRANGKWPVQLKIHGNKDFGDSIEKEGPGIPGTKVG